MNRASREKQLREITSQWQPSLRRLCAGYEHSVGAQNELLREMLIAIWRSLPHDPQECSLKSWVYRIALNVALRHMARHARKKRKSGPPTEAQLAKEAERRHQKFDALRTAVHRLKPLDRQVMLLHLEGIPRDEIAEVTGLGKSNISTRLDRAQGRLTKAEQRLANAERPARPDTTQATDRHIDFGDVEELWNEQKPASADIPLRTLKHLAARSARKVVYRDIREWAVALVLAPFFVWQAVLMESPLMRIASIELAVTCVYVSFRLYRNGVRRSPGDETLNTNAYLDAHRASLLGQADFLLRSRIWHLLPFAIGGVLLIVGIMLALASIGAPAKVLWIVAIVGTAAMLFLWLVDWLHLRGVRKLRDRAAQLSDADGH